MSIILILQQNFPIPYDDNFFAFSYFRHPGLQIWHLTLSFSTEEKEQASSVENDSVKCQIRNQDDGD